MNRNLKIFIGIFTIGVVLFFLVGISMKLKKEKSDNSKLKIVTSTFSSYDFAKHIVKDKANVVFLMDPGADSHSFEPSASDLIKLKNADMFIYLGGDIEKWADKVLESNIIDQEKTVLIKATDCINLLEESEVDGAEEDEEEEDGAFDEHIWSSPENAVKMMNYITEKIATLDEENREFYENNSNEYISEIRDMQAKIKEVVDNKVRDRLIFGDKMPMQYFLNEYGLKSSAAFNGCSTETEPSAKTISYLINKVREENIPVVLYIELSTGKTAKAIANETGAKAMQIQTLHNVSKDDFKNGETYVSLMLRNIDVLKEALT